MEQLLTVRREGLLSKVHIEMDQIKEERVHGSNSFMLLKPKIKAAFLDRDGTLVREPWGPTIGGDVILNEKQLQLLPHTVKGLQKLSSHFTLFVVAIKMESIAGKYQGPTTNGRIENLNKSLKNTEFELPIGRFAPILLKKSVRVENLKQEWRKKLKSVSLLIGITRS